MRKFIVLLICLIPQAFAAPPPAAETNPAGPAPTVRKFADVMNQFKQAPEFLATNLTLRSIELDFDVRDLVLAPTLEASVKRITDMHESVSPVYKKRSDLASATLTKPFSTGTTFHVTPTFENALAPSRTPSDTSNFSWEVGITQNLWQDAFGRSTRLRWSREGYERRQQVASALVSQAQLAVDFESLYWDWAVNLRERELRNKNVVRGREIVKWIRGRVTRAAAETTDLLQAESLLANEELQLAAVEQNIRNAAAKAVRYLPGAWQPDPEELRLARNFEDLPFRWTLDDLARVEKLELVSARNSALAAEKRADESRESIRPDLELQLAYAKNGLTDGSDRASRAVRESFEANHELSTVAVVFRTGLDLGLEYKKVEGARAARDSAKAKREALESEGLIAWDQLKRNVTDMRDRTEQARKLSEIQTRKANAERQRYRLGRTTAFQAITYEQDAADSEIALWNLYAAARKSEAQARLYAR